MPVLLEYYDGLVELTTILM